MRCYRVLQEPKLRSKKADIRPDNANLNLERADLRLEKPNLRPARLVLRPERLDLRSERLDLRPERPDSRAQRPDLRPERPDEGGGTNKQTNKRKSPCVLQEIVPFGAAAQKEYWCCFFAEPRIMRFKGLRDRQTNRQTDTTSYTDS